jgi:hypothetical protein
VATEHFLVLRNVAGQAWGKPLEFVGNLLRCSCYGNGANFAFTSFKSTHNQKVPKQLACPVLGLIYPDSRDHVATPWVSNGFQRYSCAYHFWRAQIPIGFASPIYMNLWRRPGGWESRWALAQIEQIEQIEQIVFWHGFAWLRQLGSHFLRRRLPWVCTLLSLGNLMPCLV